MRTECATILICVSGSEAAQQMEALIELLQSIATYRRGE